MMTHGPPGDSPEKSLILPVTLRIGVTGHRTLQDETLIRTKIREVLSAIHNHLNTTPYTLEVLSPLADGADRLVADEVLNWKPAEKPSRVVSSRLFAVLPMKKEEYRKTFSGPGSDLVFEGFLKKATTVKELSPPSDSPVPAANHHAEYLYIGKYVVHNCDILIAIWDGQQGKEGGTGDIVRYARKVGRTLFWIHSKTGIVTREQHGDQSIDFLDFFNTFNHEGIDTVSPVQAGVKIRYQNLENVAVSSGLDSGLLTPLCEYLLPQLERASTLAKKYQKYHYYGGVGIYILAALAVALVTIQVFFLPHNRIPIMLEVVVILAILFLMISSYNGDWHRKWLDYRFLAERIRAQLFMSLLCEKGMEESEEKSTRLAHRPKDWVVSAIQDITAQVPEVYCSLRKDPSITDTMKKFLLAAWIENQLSYYQRSGIRQKRNYYLLLVTGLAIFFLTLVISLAHFWFHPESPGDIPSETILLASVSIILPAVGSAIAAIRSFREFRRNYQIYNLMAHRLETIRNEIDDTQDPAEYTALFREANRLMFFEHNDWRVVFSFKDVSL